MKDDASLNDEQLESEIRLVGDLVLAASQSEGRLSQDEIDALLGLDATAGDDAGRTGEGQPGSGDELEPGTRAS